MIISLNSALSISPFLVSVLEVNAFVIFYFLCCAMSKFGDKKNYVPLLEGESVKNDIKM